MRTSKKRAAMMRARTSAKMRGHLFRLLGVAALVFISAAFSDTRARADSRDDARADAENARWARLSWFSWRDWKYWATHSRSSHAAIRGYQQAVDEKVYHANLVIDKRVIPLLKDINGDNGRVAQARGVVVGGGSMVGMLVAPEFTLPLIGGYNMAAAPVNKFYSQIDDAERILRRPGFNIDPAEIERLERDRKILYNFDIGLGSTALGASAFGQAGASWYMSNAFSRAGLSTMGTEAIFGAAVVMGTSKGTLRQRFQAIDPSALAQDVLMAPVWGRFGAFLGTKFKVFHPRPGPGDPRRWFFGLRPINLAKGTALLYAAQVAHKTTVKAAVTWTDPYNQWWSATVKVPLGTLKFTLGEMSLRAWPGFFPPDKQWGPRGNPKFMWANKIVGFGIDLISERIAPSNSKR